MLERYRVEITSLASKIREVRARHRRYLPPELKRELAEVGRRVADEGLPLRALARAVGIDPDTLKRYVAASEARRGPFVPVAVEPAKVDAAEAQLVLVSPSGWRLEGLELREALALLREVG